MSLEDRRCDECGCETWSHRRVGAQWKCLSCANSTAADITHFDVDGFTVNWSIKSVTTSQAPELPPSLNHGPRAIRLRD